MKWNIAANLSYVISVTFIILATNLKRSLAKMHLVVSVKSISSVRMYHSTQEKSLLQSACNTAELDFLS